MKNRIKTQIGLPTQRLLLFCLIAGALAGSPAAGRASAQTPPSSSAPQSNSQQSPKPKSSQDANPFPEDTNSVPVLPSANSPATPPPSSAPDNSDSVYVPLPSSEGDPVKSPDDATPATEGEGGSSSSDAGMDNLLRPPPDEEQGSKQQKGKNRKLSASDQPQAESAQQDENVGSYYLDQKNWKAALSRFESALVLDPENPEVYWGLAESQRHTGDYAGAKANYGKVIEYDPDSKHSKEAKKILQQPEMANAKAVSKNTGAPQ